jgi:hypothetical protein
MNSVPKIRNRFQRGGIPSQCFQCPHHIIDNGISLFPNAKETVAYCFKLGTQIQGFLGQVVEAIIRHRIAQIVQEIRQAKAL